MKKLAVAFCFVTNLIFAQATEQPAYSSLSLSELEAQATGGSGEALNELGERYHFERQGVTQDFKKAREYYLQAVEHKSAKAANHLGRLYLNGEGVEKNPKEAEKWYHKSVELDPSISNRCDNGNFPDKSFCALLLIARSGNARAMQSVGEIYLNGIQSGNNTILPRNAEDGKEWLVKAARSGQEEGLRAFPLLHYYCKEKLIPCDSPEESEEWKKEGLSKGLKPMDFF